MKRIILTYTLAFSLLSAYAGEGGSPPLKNTDKSLLIDYVDPFIGTTNFGTTNPGAICPNGMMSVVPFNVMGSSENTYDKDARWWSTPYEYTNCFFTGYAHVNLSGVGCPELGSLLLMPTTGELNVDYKEYGSKYKDEQASPGYYSNYLTKYNVKTEVSATPRSGIARFTFPKGKSHILLNLGEGLTNESGAMLRRVSDSEVEGVKLLGTFCQVRMKRLRCGDIDNMLEAMGGREFLQNKTVLDCTLGFASDAIISSYGVGPKGKVIGLEVNPLIALIVKDGLKTYLPTNYDLKSAMDNITVINQDYLSFLKEQEDNSFDVIYFDPMFRHALTDSKSLNPLRQLADMRAVNHEALNEAKRVAKYRIVFKENSRSLEFSRLGFTKICGGKYAPIHYGVIDLN